MESVIYFGIAVLLSFFSSFSGAFHASTLYWGRLLAGLTTKEDISDLVLKTRISIESISNPGLQGGLTTRSHQMRQNLSYIVTICLLISGFIIFKWYVPVLTLIGIFLLRFIIQALLPKSDSDYFKTKIISELTSQRDYFKRNQDNIKEEATEYFLNKMMHYTNLDKPEAQNMESTYYLSPTAFANMSKRALEKYVVKDFRSAIAIYDKILDLNPIICNSLKMRAQCLEILNFNLDALEDYESAFRIDNSDGNQIGLMGLLYSKIGELEKAKYYLELAVTKGWKTYEPNLIMLNTLSEGTLKVLIEKRKQPENLLRRNKDDFKENLSEIDRSEFNENLIKTIKCVNEGLSLDPENRKLNELRDNLYSKLN